MTCVRYLALLITKTNIYQTHHLKPQSSLFDEVYEIRYEDDSVYALSLHNSLMQSP